LPPTLVTPVVDLKLAQGVSSTIVIETAIDQDAFSFIPVGLVSLALNRGYDTPYLFYLGIYQDISNIAQGGPGTATNRLRYMNDIFNALAPKSIPFRTTGTVGYKFTNFPTIDPSSFLSMDGGLFYYMYEDAGTMLGVWRQQTAPAGPSSSTIADGYASAITLLSAKVKHLELLRNVSLSPRYERDASAYARSLNYYGQGSTDVGGPANSLELEVPFSSKLLGTVQKFDTTAPRSSRFLTYSSGDSISNWGIGALPSFYTSYYNGAVAPIFKFLDLTEVVHALLTALTSAMNLYISATPSLSLDQLAEIIGGLGCTYTQFFIWLRQQILYMFNDSQAIGQGITPATSPLGFRPFIVSSNTYGKLPATIALIPQVLNENLRCLKMAIRPYDTKQFNNSNNHITHIPVWGTFGGFVPVNYEVIVDGTPFPLFLPESSDPFTPNIFDGTSGGNVVDFNGSGIINDIGVNWNDTQRLLTNMYMGLTSMGGDARNGPFLQYTRYCSFVVVSRDITDMKRVPKHWKPYIKEEEEVISTGGVLQKKNSKASVKSKRLIYSPPNSSIFTEFTVGYSGMVPISPTLKENFGNLIIPVIESVNSLPSITQVQTSTQEPYVLSLTGPGQLVSSRSEEILASTFNYVKGAAGDKSELSKFIEKLSENNEGGFFGDLFSAIGPAVISGAAGILSGM